MRKTSTTGQTGAAHRRHLDPIAHRRIPRTPVMRPRAWTSACYRDMFGWATEEHHGRTLLALGRSMVAVVIRASIAPRIASELKVQDADGPVLVVMGDIPRWVFLADPNGFVTNGDELPDGVVVLDCPSRIPVPAVDTSPDRLRWVVPPDPSRRWLPTLAAVLSVIDSRTQRTVRPPAPACGLNALNGG